MLKRDFLLSEGGQRSEYRWAFWSYGFPTPQLKSLNELHVSAGWVAAVSRVQGALLDGKLRLPSHKPALVLSTAADEVLDQKSISTRSSFLSSAPDMVHEGNRDDSIGDAVSQAGMNGGFDTDHPLKRPIWEGGVVERRIGTSTEHPSAHDVLAAPSMLRVDEALKHIERWLKTHFPE